MNKIYETKVFRHWVTGTMVSEKKKKDKLVEPSGLLPRSMRPPTEHSLGYRAEMQNSNRAQQSQ